MAKERSRFVAGAKKTVGMIEARSNALFDKIEKFAGYGFNASHAVAYTVLSYWTAYLKGLLPG